MGLYALPFDNDKVVFRAHILDKGLKIDNGVTRIFLNEATAESAPGFPINTNGLRSFSLDVPLDRIPGLDQLSPPAGGHVFTFKKVAISPKERPLADALIPEDHSAYQLEDIRLG